MYFQNIHFVGTIAVPYIMDEDNTYFAIIVIDDLYRYIYIY